MRPTLAVIDIDIFSGQDELAREQVLENLDTFRNPAVTPLWLNWLRERADLRVVCLVHDLEQLDDFLVDAIRSAPGVRGTSARLAFDGMVRGEALMDLSLLDSGWDHRAAAAVMIKTQPGQDRRVFCALKDLPHHQEVEVIWVVKLFHSGEADLMVMLLGERTFGSHRLCHELDPYRARCDGFTAQQRVGLAHPRPDRGLYRSGPTLPGADSRL